jgi:transcriptional regulator with XRE-family HTH domain
MSKGNQAQAEGVRAKTELADAADLPKGDLAEKLTALFEVHPYDRKKYSPAEVAEAINNELGPKTISGTYLWQLKTGRRDNPTTTHLRAIARFFRIQPAYLIGGDEDLDQRMNAELRDAALMSQRRVRTVAYQMAALPEDGQAVVEDLTHRVAELSDEQRRELTVSEALAARIAKLPTEAREVLTKMLSNMEEMAQLQSRV